MEKNKNKEFKKILLSVVALATVALCMALLISVIHTVTSKQINKINRDKTLDVYGKILLKDSYKNGKEEELKKNEITLNKVFELENGNYVYNEKITDNKLNQIVKEVKNKKLTVNKQTTINLLELAYIKNKFQYYLYTVTSSNKYGEISSVVAIDKDSKLILSFENIYNNNTLGIGDKAHEKFTEENKKINKIDDLYDGKEFKNFLKDGHEPLHAGATFSFKTLQSMEQEVLKKHFLIKELFKEIIIPDFAGYEYLGEIKDINYRDEKEINKVKLQKGTVNTQKYGIINLAKGTNSSQFDTSYDSVNGEVSIEVFYDNNYKILFAHFIKYEHTEGTYKESNTKLLNKLIGTDLREIKLNLAKNEFSSLITGGTETYNHATKPILIEISNYGFEYGLFVNEITYEEEQILEGVKIKQGVVKTEKFDTLYIIKGSITSSFDSGYGEVSGEVEIELYYDKNDDTGKVLNILFTKYGHSDGEYKEKNEKIINTLVNTLKKDIVTTLTNNENLIAGASETYNKAVKKILVQISKYINK